jgi:hypothetical protein
MTDVTSNFTSTGASPPFRQVNGGFNVSISGTFVATVQIERSFDNGSTWLPVTADAGGTPMMFSGPVSFPMYEPEPGVVYRVNVTSYTSGSLTARLSS